MIELEKQLAALQAENEKLRKVAEATKKALNYMTMHSVSEFPLTLRMELERALAEVRK